MYNLIGLKFYRFFEGEEKPRILRLTKVEEVQHSYVLLDCNNPSEKVTIPEKELETEWIKLNPDGLMAFSCCIAVDANHHEDVPDLMVRLHTVQKNGSITPEPYAVCRQSVIDIFALMQNQDTDSKYIAGMSISKDTCPPEVKYQGCYAFKKITRNINIAVYMEDSIDDILACFRVRPYEDRLKMIKNRDKSGIPGFHENLHDFLHENQFMYDFHKCFGIEEFYTPEIDFSNPDINKLITDYIMSSTREVPVKFYPTVFTRDINLDEIQRKYVLVCPSSYKYPNQPITIVAYDVSDTLSMKDVINQGRTVDQAKKEIMEKLGFYNA